MHLATQTLPAGTGADSERSTGFPEYSRFV